MTEDHPAVWLSASYPRKRPITAARIATLLFQYARAREWLMNPHISVMYLLVVGCLANSEPARGEHRTETRLGLFWCGLSQWSGHQIASLHGGAVPAGH